MLLCTNGFINTLQTQGVDESLDQVGIYVPTQVSAVVYSLVFIYYETDSSSSVCVAALQEQRVAFGTRYEVPEVSVSNKYCNTLLMYRKVVLHHTKETVHYISGLIVFRYSSECMTSY